MEIRRNFGLDILRATAIILVLFSHTAFIIAEKFDFESTYIFGYLGVEIFFILSGFLIGGILIKLVNKPDGLMVSNIKTFWIRRWFRTLPNYYLILALNYIADIIFRGNYNPQIFSYLVFSQNLFSSHLSFFGVSWTLSVEEWFYFTFPVVMLFCFKIFSHFNLRNKFPNILFFAPLIYIAVCLILRIFYNQFPYQSWDAVFRKVVILRMDAIAIGVLFAVFKNKFQGIWLNYKNEMLWFSTLSFMLLYVYFINTYVFSRNETYILKTFFFTLISLSLAFSLPFFENLKSSKYNIINYFVMRFSLYSYSIYLIQSLINPFFNSKIVTRAFHINPFLKFTLVWITIYFISASLYKYFEKPTTDLRDRLKKN